VGPWGDFFFGLGKFKKIFPYESPGQRDPRLGRKLQEIFEIVEQVILA
jgi:hypothetical protein